MKKYCFYLLILFFSIFNSQAQEYAVKNNITHWSENTTLGEFQYRAGNLGFWSEDEMGLPAFHFAAELPLKTVQPNGNVINDPVDPTFLIGNYRFNMFIHTSGRYSVMSMERATSRLNYGTDKSFNTSENKSEIVVNGKKHVLTGLDSPLATSLETEKVFGAGYAVFNYNIDEKLKLSKVISTPPSTTVKNGCSGALITVEIENKSNKAIDVQYLENITARYHLMVWDNPPFGKKRISYPVESDIQGNKAVVNFIPGEKTPLVTAARHEHARADGFPPSLIMEGIPSGKQDFKLKTDAIDNTSTIINGQYAIKIKAGETIRLHYMLGYDIHDDIIGWTETRQQLLSGIDNPDIRPFRKEWEKTIPDLKGDENMTTTELKWDAYVLHAMANWNEFYQETYIPQGTLYDYALGVSAATNDLAMHTLPMSYINPDLAKSALTFILKHANHRGKIYGSDEGAGRIPLGPFQKSHLHPTTLHALSEYLRINEDATFLNEEISFWGYENTKGTVLDRIKRLFLYLRDEISVGKNGFIRTLCSDLSDGLYFYFDDVPYFSMFHSESGSNTSLTIVTLGNLANSLENLKANVPGQENEIENLVIAIRDFREELVNATLKVLHEHNNRMPRTIINGNRFFGLDNMFLEPNSGCLAIEEIPLDIRKQINDSIYLNMVANEKLGARNLTYEIKSYKPGGWGVRHNGGYWISRHGYYTVHLEEVDHDRAWEMLKRMTMKHFTNAYPNYWVGAWSGPDEYNASVSDRAGLTSTYCQLFPVYCAHQHAWPLYAYLYLKGNNSAKKIDKQLPKQQRY